MQFVLEICTKSRLVGGTNPQNQSHPCHTQMYLPVFRYKFFNFVLRPPKYKSVVQIDYRVITVSPHSELICFDDDDNNNITTDVYNALVGGIAITVEGLWS